MVNNMFIWFQIVIATKMFSFELVSVDKVCEVFERLHIICLCNCNCFKHKIKHPPVFTQLLKKLKQIQIHLWNSQSNLLVRKPMRSKSNLLLGKQDFTSDKVSLSLVKSFSVRFLILFSFRFPYYLSNVATSYVSITMSLLAVCLWFSFLLLAAVKATIHG